jgi:hypothetical protein
MQSANKLLSVGVACIHRRTGLADCRRAEVNDTTSKGYGKRWSSGTPAGWIRGAPGMQGAVRPLLGKACTAHRSRLRLRPWC